MMILEDFATLYAILFTLGIFSFLLGLWFGKERNFTVLIRDSVSSIKKARGDK